MTDKAFKRPAWAEGPLYKLLNETFPERRTPYNIFDVYWLAFELGKSHEAVYKWLRKGRLTSRNAVAIRNLADRDENRAALEKLGRKPPKIRDFDQFVYA